VFAYILDIFHINSTIRAASQVTEYIITPSISYSSAEFVISNLGAFSSHNIEHLAESSVKITPLVLTFDLSIFIP